MSLKVSSGSQTSFPIVQQVARKQTCIGKTVQWVRKWEEGTTAQKVGIFFLKALATLLLFISIVGIPVYLALQKEYHIQAVDQKFLPFLESISPDAAKKTAPSHEPEEILAARKEQFSVSKEQFVHLKQHLLSLKSLKKEMQIRKKDLFEKYKSLLQTNAQLAKEERVKTEHFKITQRDLKNTNNRYSSLCRVKHKLSDEIEKVSRQIETCKKMGLKINLAPLRKKHAQLEKEHSDKLKALDIQIKELEGESQKYTDEYFRLCPPPAKRDRPKPTPRRFTFSASDIRRSNLWKGRGVGSVQPGEVPIRNHAGVLVSTLPIIPQKPQAQGGQTVQAAPSADHKQAALDTPAEESDSKENEKKGSLSSNLNIDSP